MYLPSGYSGNETATASDRPCETAWKCDSPMFSFPYGLNTVIWRLIMTVYPRLVLPFIFKSYFRSRVPLGQEQSQDI